MCSQSVEWMDAPFIPTHDAITCYQSACLPVECLKHLLHVVRRMLKPSLITCFYFKVNIPGDKSENCLTLGVKVEGQVYH